MYDDNYCLTDCNSCSDDCRPSSYDDCYFDINVDPYDPSVLVVTACGKDRRIKISRFLNETDTTLNVNDVEADLVYHAEKHIDEIPGESVGHIINVKELRDVVFDEGLSGKCYEFIYRKYGDCGDGCVSAGDKWYNWNINSKDAKKDYLRYVRGANVYGCPEYLDVPSRVNEWWFAGWKTDGEHKEFGYFQPNCVDTLPKDGNGNVIVMTLDPSTKQPKWGPLPLNCIMNNLVANLGVDIYGTFQIIQSTPEFTYSFNTSTGDFSITWNDWYYHFTRHVGTGTVYGKLNMEYRFDVESGTMNYRVNSVYFSVMSWRVDAGAPPEAGPITLTFDGVSVPSGEHIRLIDHYEHDARHNWDIPLDATIPCSLNLSVAPGQTVGPFNYAYVFNQWEGLDDEGYLQVNFKNKMQGWDSCPTHCPSGNCACGTKEDGTCKTCLGAWANTCADGSCEAKKSDI